MACKQRICWCHVDPQPIGFFCSGCGCQVRGILELEHSGDPYGSGFYASEHTAYGLVYRGDLGDRPRSFWRSYARRHNYILREA